MSKKNTNTAPEVVATSVVATAPAGNTVATPKTTKWEQLAKCHADLCRNDLGEVKITCPEFRDLAAGQRYEFKCKCTGKTWHIHITEKISDYDAGGHTVISGTLNGEKFANLNISQLKDRVECEYRREKNGSNNDKTPAGKLYYLLSKSEVVKLAEECKDPQILATLTQLRGLTGTEKKAEDEARAKAKAENDAKVKQEKKDNSLIAQVAQRLGISEAEAKKMLGL